MNTHIPQHPSQKWRGAAETRDQAHTPTPHTPARSGGVEAERAHKHAHTQTSQPGVAGRSRNPSPGTHTHTARPARCGGVQAERAHKHTHTPSPQPGVSERSRNRSPSTTQTQTQAPHNSRKPSVHSPGTEAARAMQVTLPNKMRSRGPRLHPKACAALGLEAERVTPKPLGTPVPRTCMHALGTRYARKSGEPLWFRPKEGTCASTGAHHPGMTITSRWRQSALPVMPGADLLGSAVKSSGI